MKVNPSALKHGISQNDTLYAAEDWIYASDLDDDVPAKQFLLGFDTNGRFLAMATSTFDSGNRLLIHAMKARGQYLHLLE